VLSKNRKKSQKKEKRAKKKSNGIILIQYIYNGMNQINPTSIPVSKSSEGVDSNGCAESVTLPPLKTRWATATATPSKPVLQARRWRFPRSGAVL
jgi:hypothetical protein